MVMFTRRNTRRYGGYIVHLGIVLIFVGLTGAIFNREQKAGIHMGDRCSSAGTGCGCARSQPAKTRTTCGSAPISRCAMAPRLSEADAAAGVLQGCHQAVGRVDIRHRLNEDLYVNFAGVNGDNVPVVEAYLFPLVNWIWIGALVLLCGTLVTLIPPLTPPPESEWKASRCERSPRLPILA